MRLLQVCIKLLLKLRQYKLANKTQFIFRIIFFKLP